MQNRIRKVYQHQLPNSFILLPDLCCQVIGLNGFSVRAERIIKSPIELHSGDCTVIGPFQIVIELVFQWWKKADGACGHVRIIYIFDNIITIRSFITSECSNRTMICAFLIPLFIETFPNSHWTLVLFNLSTTQSLFHESFFH